MTSSVPSQPPGRHSAFSEIFRAFLALGSTSFGGPVAHFAYFRSEFVERREWLTEQAYAELMALCQLLPGPASSQCGMAIGLIRGGVGGAAAAWLGFVLPSAVLMMAFGLAIGHAPAGPSELWLHGLKLAAVAVVAQAAWAMSRSLCPDRTRAALALAAAVVSSVCPGAAGQLAVILGGAIAGRALLPLPSTPAGRPGIPQLSKRIGAFALALLVVFVAALPTASCLSDNGALQLADSFFRAGGLVFGGGHVVLPMLRAQVVPNGWVTDDSFLAGYGAAQAMPGPLFSFAAYLGAISQHGPSGLAGAMLALTAIYLPGFLLVVGILPFWLSLAHRPALHRAASGINAAVVGLLIATLYNPVWSTAVQAPSDIVPIAGAMFLLSICRTPAWLVVLLCAMLARATGW